MNTALLSFSTKRIWIKYCGCFLLFRFASCRQRCQYVKQSVRRLLEEKMVGKKYVNLHHCFIPNIPSKFKIISHHHTSHRTQVLRCIPSHPFTSYFFFHFHKKLHPLFCKFCSEESYIFCWRSAKACWTWARVSKYKSWQYPKQDCSFLSRRSPCIRWYITIGKELKNLDYVKGMIPR